MARKYAIILVDKILSHWRFRAFTMPWLGYVSFYFWGKIFVVTTPIIIDELDYTKNDMAMVITVYSFSYMLGCQSNAANLP